MPEEPSAKEAQLFAEFENAGEADVRRLRNWLKQKQDTLQGGAAVEADPIEIALPAQAWPRPACRAAIPALLPKLRPPRMAPVVRRRWASKVPRSHARLKGVEPATVKAARARRRTRQADRPAIRTAASRVPLTI
jgi:hypothetical protein